MNKSRLIMSMVAAGSLGLAGCLSSASSFVPASKPITPGGYAELASEISGTCTQVQWLFMTFGAAGSPQRHALNDALGKVYGAEALVSMAVDVEQFALVSTTLMPFPILPVFTSTRVSGVPVRLNVK